MNRFKEQVIIYILIIFCVILGNQSSYSLTNSPWISQRTHCRRLSLLNGRVRHKPRLFAQFSCNPGFVLLGERYSKCQNGVWDSPKPVCVRKSCNAIPASIPNGRSFEMFGGAVVQFFCNPTYTLHGASSIYCDGKLWSAELPTCFRSEAATSGPPAMCDFESDDLCGWKHSLNHDFYWERINGATPSRHVGTGPKYDHSHGEKGNGYYMYIESSYKNINDTALLISPIYKPTQIPYATTCFELYYHMYGSGIGSLSIYIKKSSDRIFNRILGLQLVGNQGDSWKRALVNFGTVIDDFQIVIEGVRGTNYISDIAIDDVRIIEDCDNSESMTTTEEYSTVDNSEVFTVAYDTCRNRCYDKANDSFTCDCDENCSERNHCCPDFIEICVFEYTTDATETPQILTEYDTTLKPTTTLTPTTTKMTSKTSSTSFPSTRFFTYFKTSSPTSPSTSSPSTQFISSSPPSTSTSKQVRISNATVRFYGDEATLVPEDTIEPFFNDQSKPVLTNTTYRPNNSLTTKIVVVVVVAMFAFVLVIALVTVRRKVSFVGCMKIRNGGGGDFDSQSDVRFLTSDEILDFNLASPAAR